MHRFKELKVWQKSVDLAIDIYQITKKLRSDERFGLISQLNRSVVSIPSNIAGGAGRNNGGEFNHFLGITTGSSFELETQLIIANRIGYIKEKKLEEILKNNNQIQQMIFGLQKTL